MGAGEGEAIHSHRLCLVSSDTSATALLANDPVLAVVTKDHTHTPLLNLSLFPSPPPLVECDQRSSHKDHTKYSQAC